MKDIEKQIEELQAIKGLALAVANILEAKGKEVQGLIDKLKSSKPEDAWIDCNKRVPDSTRYILLSFSNFFLPAVGRYEKDEEGGAFYLGDEDETCVSQDLFVNAWMELPKRYKEK